MTHWALLDYSITSTPTQVTLITHTSTPAHLFAHYTTIQPVRTLLPRIRRGIQVFCYPRWSFTSQGYIEQTEPGETLEHTFIFDPWLNCITRWVLLSAQTDLTIKDSSGPILKYHNYTATRYEYFLIPTYVNFVSGQTWHATKITPTLSHSVTYIRLYLHHVVGTPGPMTVSIKAIDVNGHPTGPDLCSGDLDTTLLTVTGWYSITMTTPENLISGITYAIVARCPAGTGADYVYWYSGAVSGGNGKWEKSSDSGITWYSYTAYTLTFEVYGFPT